jgi:hypothetical protein
MKIGVYDPPESIEYIVHAHMGVEVSLGAVYGSKRSRKKPGFDGEAGSARGRKRYSGHTASSQGAWLSIRYAWCDEQGD